MKRITQKAGDYRGSGRCKGWSKATDRRGMTMAEVLIVVAIILILAGVVFIAVLSHQRSLAQLERDKIAKEIFIASQNHITAAEGAGYPGLIKMSDKTDTNESDIDDQSGYKDGSDYYIVVNDAVADEGKGQKMLNLILPFGAIDETVRAGGSYIIKYNRTRGEILEVFYCSQAGTRFGHNLSSEDYEGTSEAVEKPIDEMNKKERRNCFGDEKAVLGKYGGGEGLNDTPLPLKKSTVTVDNSAMLTVNVEDANTEYASARSILLVTGVSSGAKKYFELERESKNNITYKEGPARHIIVLDDITEGKKHFADLFADTSALAHGNGKAFIPGENLKLQVVNFSTEELATIQYSAEKTTNSLFWDVEPSIKPSSAAPNPTVDIAYINDIRHLQNLDTSISNRNANGGSGKPPVSINKGSQTNDLIWVDGDSATDDFVSQIREKKGSSAEVKTYRYNNTDPFTANGWYLPADLTGIEYNGKNHSVSRIKAGGANAGLFGTLSKCVVKNLELIDFDIDGGSNAGALAGVTATSDGVSTDVSNVVAHNSSKDAATGETRVIEGPAAGGLIGNMAGGKISYSAAALTVRNSSTAGGLIGKSSGGTVEGCYSGGHTDQGEFYKHSDGVRGDAIYNVTASSKAGGLIGDAGSTTIKNSYATCSVSAPTAGGFVGSASGSISDCYCAGLVETAAVPDDEKDKETPTNSSRGAFAGSYTGTAARCNYLSVLNEVVRSVDGTTVDHYLRAVGDRNNKEGISPFDASTAAYNLFVDKRNTWAPANAYDPAVRKYYRLKYNLRTVNQLPIGATKPTSVDDSRKNYFVNTHYGDWPAPEIFIIN